MVDCLCSAGQAVIEATDFEDAVVRAVRFGNDTDTTAAVAGGLAGFMFGLDSIPSTWLSDLRLTDDQRRLINRFVDTILAIHRSADREWSEYLEGARR